MKSVLNYEVPLKQLADLAQAIASTHILSGSLKEYVRLLKIEESPMKSRGYIVILLQSLLKMIEERGKKEVFVFDGSADSGVRISSDLILPDEGYCFFGWIRYELAMKNSKTCIFYLSSMQNEIQLSLTSGIIEYSVLPLFKT